MGGRCEMDQLLGRTRRSGRRLGAKEREASQERNNRYERGKGHLLVHLPEYEREDASGPEAWDTRLVQCSAVTPERAACKTYP